MMKKRVLCLALAVLLTLSLLPLSAGAADEPKLVSGEGWKTSEDGNLHLNKQLTQNADGTYNIEMTAYATGTVETHVETEQVPTDFILVLDQSGSMEESFGNGYKLVNHSGEWTLSDLSGNTAYYVRDVEDGQYYQVKIENTGSYSPSTGSMYLRSFVSKDKISGLTRGDEYDNVKPEVVYYAPTDYYVQEKGENSDGVYHRVYASYYRSYDGEYYSESTYYYVSLYYFKDDKDARAQTTQTVNPVNNTNSYFGGFRMNTTSFQNYSDFKSLVTNNKLVFITNSDSSYKYKDMNGLSEDLYSYKIVYSDYESTSSSSRITDFPSDRSFYTNASAPSAAYYEKDGEKIYLIDSDTATYSGSLYTSGSLKRLDALQSATRAFVDMISAQNNAMTEQKIKNRVAIVGFSNGDSDNGSYIRQYLNTEILTVDSLAECLCNIK